MQRVPCLMRMDKTDYLIIDLPLGIRGALDVVVHLPPGSVGGEVNQFPEVTFKLEKHTRLLKALWLGIVECNCGHGRQVAEPNSAEIESSGADGHDRLKRVN
jgi:hypothetical protein